MSAGAGPRGPIVITGPTASGKGTLAFELALRLRGEIISLDSMKLYRELDVGTAKPSLDRRQRVPYHLLDILDPDRSFSTGEYLPLLEKAIKDVQGRGHQPILAGGTALYLKAFLGGFQAGPQADWELRTRLFEEARLEGLASLHARLAQADPVTAAKIHPHDSRRVVRALEVLQMTGRPMSEDWDWNRSPSLRRDVAVLGLEWPRDQLYDRINLRVERMVADGLFGEAQRLRVRVPPVSRTAAQSIGYKEIWEGLDLGRPEREIVERIQQNTRKLAKSQLTWFRKMPITWIPATRSSRSVDLVEEALRKLDQD